MRHRSIQAFLFAAVASGCGGNQPASTSTSSSTSSTNTGGAATTTTSTTSATGGSTGTGGAPAGTKTAVVGVFSGAQSASVLHGYKATAAFLSAPDGLPGVSTTSYMGACAITVYTQKPTPGTPVPESVGTVTITGGNKPLSLVPDASGKYASLTDTTDLFAGGEMITVAWTGFGATLIAPVPVDLTAPAEPLNKAPLPVDRTKDLVFAWNNGGAGRVTALFDDANNTSLRCDFASSAGMGAVPKEALAALAPASMGSFSIAAASTLVTHGTDGTTIVAVGNTLTWDGVVNPQTFTYQASN